MFADALVALTLGLTTVGGPKQEAAPDAPLIKVQELEVGKGAEIKPGDLVTLHFVVRVPQGKELANSYRRGLPFTFQVSDQTQGFWETCVRGMRSSGRRTLVLPAGIAYGATGRPPFVPAGAPIEATVAVVEVRAIPVDAK
jgi:peptidylprolyl isomerase